MKKLIIALICLAGLSSCNLLWPFDFWPFECDRGSDSPSYCVEWYLKNTTAETIVLNSHDDMYYRSVTIPQKSDTLIDSSTYANEDDVFTSAWNTGDSVVIKLHEKVVCVWRKSEKNTSGKQFFNMSFWTKSTGVREKRPCRIWTFEITPEDIVPNE
jgi:hypothetical protein